jgi:5-methylcytosine-specific restriction endonuclease McrA
MDKTCSKCRKSYEMNYDNFPRGAAYYRGYSCDSVYGSWCRKCVSEYRESNKKQNGSMKDRPVKTWVGVMKCKICLETKPTMKFGYCRTSESGFDYKCSTCSSIRDCLKGEPCNRQRIRIILDKIRSYNYKCVYCDSDYESIDHFFPRNPTFVTKFKGTNHIDNLFPCCRNCNLDKAAKDPWEWMELNFDNHKSLAHLRFNTNIKFTPLL